MSISKGGTTSQLNEFKQIKQLIEENKNLIQGLEERTKKIHNYIKWQRVFLILKVVIIVIPLTIGLIYLPPLLQDVITPYQELLGNVNNLNDTAETVNNNTTTKSSFDVNALLNGFSQ